jgi:hypothetical protein
MKLEPGNFCPLIQKECVGLQCSWFTQVRGTNPNNGEEIDEWGCAVAWLPYLQIENSQQSRQTGAAVESFRNEVVQANRQNQQLYMHYMEEGKISPQVNSINPINNQNILNSGE